MQSLVTVWLFLFSELMFVQQLVFVHVLVFVQQLVLVHALVFVQQLSVTVWLF